MTWNKLLNNNRLRPSTRHSETDARNDFESDFGRTIFSAAMRRMHDKTQVFPLTTDDNTHTRLTHSMEVMAIGHSLGIKICEDRSFQLHAELDKTNLFREIPIILKNACLVHDIGNPPFGHFGETAIQTFFQNYFSRTENSGLKLGDICKEDFTLFDGNAQGFRVLTRLQMLDDEYGLNLTFGTLSTYMKYPNFGKKDKAQIGKKKRGVFQTEVDYLNKISEDCGLRRGESYLRHPLCFLMEAADSICYLVMDIEDGYNKGWYDLEIVCEYLKSVEGITEKFEELKKLSINYGADLTRFVKFRIYLIQRLVDVAVNNFLKNVKEIENGQYNEELIFDDKTGLAEALKDFCQNKIFPNREITSLELTGHSVLTGLLEYYTGFLFHSDAHYRNRAQGLISDSILRSAFLENKLPENSKIEKLNNYFKLRIIVDFISGMTDQFALNHYQKLSGQKIN
jgi:dGTPase